MVKENSNDFVLPSKINWADFSPLSCMWYLDFSKTQTHSPSEKKKRSRKKMQDESVRDQAIVTAASSLQ